MTREEVRAAVIEQLAMVFQRSEAELPDEVKLKGDLAANSQTLWAAAAILEKASGKEVNFLDLAGCETLGDAFDLAAD